MKIAIMQPYLFPYIGYFQLINATDKFVVFDDVEYVKRRWMNRNRILSANIQKEWIYITVPIKRVGQKELIKNIKINYDIEWNKEILGKLTYYKKIRAPYYDITIQIIDNIFNKKNEFLTELNTAILKAICDYLDINFNYKISSKSNYNYNSVKEKDEWALEIAIQENADIYYNPIGGMSFFDKKKFLERGINIEFLEVGEIIYQQSKRKFVPNLSIIDVMMFNSKEQIKEMLNKFSLIK